MTTALSDTTAAATRGEPLPWSAALPWPASLAWGAGLVLAGLGGATITGGASSPAARAIGALAVALGLAALVWGAACLSRGRIVTPRVALTGSVGGVGLVGALLAATDGRASALAGAIAVALLVSTAAIVAASRRHPHGTSTGRRSAASGLLSTVAAAALVALVVTPALGAVQDAALLKSDGTIVVVDPHGGH